jgi:hypothetical protein
MKIANILGAIIFMVGSCKCPELLTPVITVNSNSVDVGKTMMIGVPPIKNTTVYWTGPDTTYVGNPWIRPNTTPAMSGSYSVKYVCDKRKKYRSAIASAELKILTCPTLPSPELFTSANPAELGSTVILTTPAIAHTTVSWVGPSGNFSGNSWIIQDAGVKMSGSYTAKYVYPGIAHCESAKDSIFIRVYDPVIAKNIAYNGSNYNAVLKWTTNTTAQVWLKPSTAENRIEKAAVVGTTVGPLQDILLLELYITSTTPGEVAKAVVNTIKFMDNANTLVGCFASAGAVACAAAIGLTEGVAIPECVVFLKVSDPALISCVKGVAEEIGSEVGLELPWQGANLAVSLAGGEAGDMIKNTIFLADDIAENKPSTYKDGTIQVAPPPVAQPRPTPNGNPHGGGGQPPPIDPCAVCPECCECQDCNPDPVIGDGEDDAEVVLNDKIGKQGLQNLNDYLGASVKDKKIQTVQKINVDLSHLIRDAEAILFSTYGQQEIVRQRPYKVYKMKGYWIIRGNKDSHGSKPNFSMVVGAISGDIIKMEDK